LAFSECYFRHCLQADFKYDPQLEEIVTGYKDRPRMHYYDAEEGTSSYAFKPDFIGLKKNLDLKEHGSQRRVVLHELAHSTGHGKRLARESFADQRAHEEPHMKLYSAEEIIAELTAQKIMREKEILSPADLKVSNGYIRHWAKGFETNEGKTLGECRRAAEPHATAAAEYILGHPLKNQRRKARKAANKSPAKKQLAVT
jgi:antirestriction protein ArdC